MDASPISRLGGKSRLRKTIISKVPEHKNYVEVFAGAAWVYFGKDPSKVEIINDIDSELVNYYRIIREHKEEFLRIAKQTPASRQEFERYKNQSPESLTDIHRAVRYFYLIKHSFSSKMAHYTPSASARPKLNIDTIDNVIELASQRLNRTYIENMSFDKLIPRYDRDYTFFYIDPPYWNCENDYGVGVYSREDHYRLHSLLSNISGKFMMSINDVPEIRDLYKDYKIEEVMTKYSVGKGISPQIQELLIMNY